MFKFEHAFYMYNVPILIALYNNREESHTTVIYIYLSDDMSDLRHKQFVYTATQESVTRLGQDPQYSRWPSEIVCNNNGQNGSDI